MTRSGYRRAVPGARCDEGGVGGWGMGRKRRPALAAIEAAAAAERLPLAHAGKVSLYLWTHWIECAHHITNPKTCDDDIVIGAETEPLKCLYRSSSSLLLALLADAAT